MLRVAKFKSRPDKSTAKTAGKGDYEGANPEDPDEYTAENILWVPQEARWADLQAAAKQPNIGKLVDDAMAAIERDKPRLKGVLPKDYARSGFGKQRLGELIYLIATGEDEKIHRSGGRFVQPKKLVGSHGGKLGDISIYGQGSNSTTRHLAIMNLDMRDVEADFGPEHADTFRRNLHSDLCPDYVLAKPTFEDSDWFRKVDNVRWRETETTASNKTPWH